MKTQKASSATSQPRSGNTQSPAPQAEKATPPVNAGSTDKRQQLKEKAKRRPEAARDL
jgi:hypothetical protein